MKGNCLDIGIVQAFMDGELPHDQVARVSDHLEGCDSCAFMLSEAEDQSAMVFSAMDREFNSLVPTQRLWSKINESLDLERETRPLWQKAQAFLVAMFASPSMVAAAGLLIVVGVFSILLLNRVPVSSDLAVVPDRNAVIISGLSTQKAVEEPRESSPVTKSPVGDTVVELRPRIEQAAYRPRGTSRTVTSERATPAVSNGYMEGEESYVRTISSLSRTVEEQKDSVLRPSERVAYERDMALVNDTIAKMRQEVKRNPRNDSAKQVLYSSYQNKIDLLNSVSQKEELVASLSK